LLLDYSSVNLSPYPTHVNPEKYRLSGINPGVLTKPGVGFVGWKPGVDFAAFVANPTSQISTT